MDVDRDLEESHMSGAFQTDVSGNVEGHMSSEWVETLEDGMANDLSGWYTGSFSVEGKIFVRKVGSETFVIALFQGAETLFIRGAVDCRQLYGTATCFGFPLVKRYLPIISSNTAGMLSIETLEETQTSSLSDWYAHQMDSPTPLWTQEDLDLRLDTFVKHLVHKGSEEMANSIRSIVVFKKCNSLAQWPLLRDEIIGKLKMTITQDMVTDLETATLIGRLEKRFRAFYISPSWRSLIASWAPTTPPNEFMVCGKKHVGKSTLVRYLLNALIAKYGKAILLDCDLGQPEITAPGIVSMSVLTNPLTGPSFTNIQLACPIWHESHFIGHVSAKEKLDDILSSASVLFARCKFSGESQFIISDKNSNFPDSGLQNGNHLAPIVINTHGWIEGPGYDTLFKMMQTFTPKQLIQIISPSESLLFQPDECAPYHVSLIRFHPVIEHTSYVTIQSTEKRQMQILSALSAPSRVTYRLPMSAFRIHLLDVEVPPSQWMYVLNGSMVALVVDSSPYTTLSQAATLNQKLSVASVNVSTGNTSAKESEILKSHSESETPTQAQQGVSSTRSRVEIDPTLPEFLLERPSFVSSYCVGVGIITSIDLENRSFYLSTSVPRPLLLEVNTIIKGAIEIPPALPMANAVPATPYLTADNVSSQGTGSGNLSIRNNLIRGKAQ